MHPSLQILQPWIAQLGDPPSMPSVEQLNRWGGAQVPQFASVDCAGLPYELHIAEHRQVPTRADNWHDALNALCWLAWPRSKWAINRAHQQILLAGGEAERRNRSPARDVLTLLDEGGAVILSSWPQLFELLRECRWADLFVGQRERVLAHARLLLIGHASLDELRAPRLGVTCKCLFFNVSQEALDQPWESLRGLADKLVAERLSDPARLGRGRDYAPLPVLGWPGWHPDNHQSSFYIDHPSCFRPHPASRAVAT